MIFCRPNRLQILIRSHANFDPIAIAKIGNIFPINCMDHTACNSLKFHRFSIDF